MAIPADHRNARPGDPQFRTDHVHNALIGVPQSVQFHAELGAVARQHFHLLAAQRLGNRFVLVLGGYVMVGGGDDTVRAGQSDTALTQSVEGLRTGHLVNQVTVDIKHLVPTRHFGDYVGVPDFVKEGLGHVDRF